MKKRFQFLGSLPHSGKDGPRLYYIDGRRVSFERWRELKDACTLDTFLTVDRNGRWLHYCCGTLGK